MNPKQNRCNIWANGFDMKMLNRRTIVRQDGETWIICFRRLHDAILEPQSKDRYSHSFDRFGRTITEAIVRITDEAFRGLAEASIYFLQLKESDQ